MDREGVLQATASHPYLLIVVLRVESVRLQFGEGALGFKHCSIELFEPFGDRRVVSRLEAAEYRDGEERHDCRNL